jgi:hypothetical protein
LICLQGGHKLTHDVPLDLDHGVRSIETSQLFSEKDIGPDMVVMAFLFEYMFCGY